MFIIELTRTQKDIYDLLKKKKNATEISKDLNLSKQTVYNNISIINKKLKGAPNKNKVKVQIKQKEYINNEETIDEKTQISFYENQVSYWKKKYDELQKISSYESRIIKLFENSIYKFNSKKPISINKNPNLNDYDEELVLLISDVHAGEEISFEQTLGINEYNMDIMIKRLDNLYNHVINIFNKMNGNHKKLNLWMLGDMVSGLIHDELLQGTSIVDEVIILADKLANFIYGLLDYFEEIEVACVIGNHGRMKKKPHYKNKYNNFDYFVYKFIETKLENIDNVKFLIPKSPMLIIQKYDYNFLLMHGDSKVQSYAGIPFYGIRRADSQLTQLLTATKDIYPHYITMGHFHTSNTLEKVGGKIIMNGCLSGTNEHSMGTIFTGTDPKQTLFSVNEKYGVNWILDIFVD